MKTTASTAPPGDRGTLSVSFKPPNLENKLLSQTSALLKPQRSVDFSPQSLLRSSLQFSSLTSTTSSLTSTTSSLLSTASPSSSLLSTHNKLLHSPSAFTSKPSTVSASLGGTSLDQFVQCRKRKDQEDEGDRDSSRWRCVQEESTERCSEDHVDESKESSQSDFCIYPWFEDVQEESEEKESEEEKEISSAILDSPVHREETPEPDVTTRLEFEEQQRDKEDEEEEMNDKKYLLLNLVCGSLVNKSKSPGQDDWDNEDGLWSRITNLSKDISELDPQFLLKVAVYTRQELNTRITANFLLALAASLSSTKPHVRRYFCAAVQLPSDWLEVVRIYSTCFSRSLPMCLKKGLTDKFKQFSEYQLAKYNTRKHRCKHSHKKLRRKKPTEEQLNKWANLVRSKPDTIRKFCMGDRAEQAAVDKKQSEFSLKKMIRQLHIKEPAEHVMAILRNKYPGDAKAFTRSGIKGTWDRDRAGTRMKLKEPLTWDRLLSLEGNNARTWEKLIDVMALPFMAMLRNLRNMIVSGISDAHHQKILNKLTNKYAVIRSRQFPLRFLAAYKVIMKLQTSLEKQSTALRDVLRQVLEKIPRSRRFARHSWDRAPRSRLRCALTVPLVYKLYRSRRAQLLRAGKQSYSVELLQRYREALEAAVQISCRYNIPPLPGKTVVFLNATMHDFKPQQDFCLPPRPDSPESEGEGEERPGYRTGRRIFNPLPQDPLAPTLSELGALLSLMIGSSAEDFSLVLTVHWSDWEQLELTSDELLNNVHAITTRFKQIDRKKEEDDEGEEGVLKERPDIFSFLKQQKPDNIIVVTENWSSGLLLWAIDSYRKEVNNKALHVEVCLNTKSVCYTADGNYMSFSGFSDQLLRFLSERGSSRLLTHVENLDKVYNVPPAEGAKEPLSNSSVVSVAAFPRTRWRTVRVFISSTFRDMQTERDALVRSVFPELRRRAAPHGLHLQEVELRWGVTEEEEARAAELCLREVCRSQMMVVLLGERYGLVPPPTLNLPELPQYSWLADAPEGLSMTEMEIRQFEALYPDLTDRMFCYFRDPSVSESVPLPWREEFSAESKQAESKMAALKRRLWESQAEVHDNYWIELDVGAVDEKPCLKNLELFCETVVGDVWTALQGQFIKAADECSDDRELSEQEVQQEGLCGQFFGRSKLLSTAVTVVEQTRGKGGVLLLEAGAGQGKTVFMAALGQALKTTEMRTTATVSDVISYSTAASQSARSVHNLLLFLVKSLRRRRNGAETELPRSHQDLLSEFHTALGEDKKQSVVILVDGVDLIVDDRGLVVSDWIPQRLPKGVCLVVSVHTSSSLIQTLSKRRSTVVFSLTQLSLSDRRDIIQKKLDAFGKRLSDSAFDNQVQTLMMKKGAVSPLYLHLACEHLRTFTTFHKLKDSLQSLPQSLSELVRFSLDRLCSENREIPGLHWALAALTLSSASGLRERDLYSLLNTCSDLFSPEGALTWDRALEHSRKHSSRVSMIQFSQIIHILHSLVGPNCSEANDLLLLSRTEGKRAFEETFLPTESDRSRAHLLLAAHLWTSADPLGNNTFLHSEASFVLQLPLSLMESNQTDALTELLCSYHFMSANVRHGLLHHLLKILNSFRGVDREEVEERLSFLQRHSSLLSLWPSLFVQQALNEPPQSSAHAWAQSMMGRGGIGGVVKWLNSSRDTSAVVCSLPWEPSCLALAPDEQTAVVGTGRGTLHFVHTETGQVLRSLTSGGDGISSCVFVQDGSLVATSFDGRIEMWDVENGCRTVPVRGHNSAITGSDVTADRKHLATASLDFTVKVWSWSKGQEVASLLRPCPVNCVTFDPDGLSLAAGGWDGEVIVWNWLRSETVACLVGHSRSVRCVAFSSSSLLCSGSVSGEVRVWSVSGSSCVGRFRAHYGATEALTFIDGGDKLLSAGDDHTLQLWSAGLGRSVVTLQSEKSPAESRQSRTTAPSADPVLSVAVIGETAAVATSHALHLHSLDSGNRGEMIWSEAMSVRCLLWVTLDTTDPGDEGSVQGSVQGPVLVLGLQSGRLQLWVAGEEAQKFLGGMVLASELHFHRDAVLALAENHTYIASASGDCSVALWRRSELTDSHSGPFTVLRGHSGAVTCLSFSPDGDKLVSGAKDQTLQIWECGPDSTPVLVQTLRHCHRDWITGCSWTEACIVSSSNDGRLCFWDSTTGERVKEICWTCPLSSVCAKAPYVVAGGSDGALHVWNFESGAEICHVSAHHRQINHCALLTDDADPEELTVATASDDGTVTIWKPLQVEHCGSFQGHSGVRGVVPKSDGPELLSVSEDGSLCSWDRAAENPQRNGSITALCFSNDCSTVVAGFQSGSLQFWTNNELVGHKQVSESAVTALCSMPDSQLAAAFPEPRVDVFKMMTSAHGGVSVVPVCSHWVEEPVKSLLYCSELLGVTVNERIFGAPQQSDKRLRWKHVIDDWHTYVRFLCWVRGDDRSVRLAGEKDGEVHDAVLKTRARKPPTFFSRQREYFGSVIPESSDEDEENEEKKRRTTEEKKTLISAATIDNDFIVCGDVKGQMWFNLPPKLSSWSSRKTVHTDRITALRLTTKSIVSASRDRTVKIWDRATKKQVGMFVCRAPVLLLEVFPEDQTKLVCGDQLGNVYFLNWSQ